MWLWLTTALHPPKVWERFVDDVYYILKRTHLEKFFHHINNLHQNIKFTMEEESNGELHYSSHHQTSCKESVVSSLFNRVYSIITNKADLPKENAGIKQVFKENGYEESSILAWKFGKFRETIHRYRVCTSCGNKETNFRFP